MNKKIVIINNGLACGGIERASSSLANNFVQRGYEVTILALYNRERFFNIDKRVKFIEPSFSSSNRYIYAIKMMCYIRRNITLISPNTILAFGEWTNAYVVAATRLLRIPLYLSDRMSPTLNLGVIQNVLRHILYQFADGIIAQTSYAKRVIESTTKSKNIIVIPNPVNVIEPIVVPKENIITTVGRLTKEKGHSDLISAFSQIKNKDWQLQIVGDGNMRESIEQQALKLGILERVNFVGHQKELNIFLSKSKIFVLPSLSEGFPNALIEAMSVPLPCISTNCIAGPSDIIRDGENGLLVEVGDIQGMAQAIDLLISEKELCSRISQNGYNIREELNFENISNRYLKFILK